MSFIHPSRVGMNTAFANLKQARAPNVAPIFAGQGALVRPGFDFGSGQALPPSRHPVKQETDYEDLPDRGAARIGDFFRSLSRTADTPLLDYLRARRVSPYFLHEIDLFLAAHPEIAHHQPQFVERMNRDRPLDAYKFFIRGYTKPARYMDGVLPPNIYEIRLPEVLDPIASMRDEELVEFFGEYAYRVDILHKIDAEVAYLAEALHRGRFITFAQRKLVVYTLYGNVADAFKFYEYNYQEEWLAHRYLPEHVALSELPKPFRKRSDMLLPFQVTQPDENPEERRSHLGTRGRMAAANDAGVDVIDVLLEDFTAALCRQGLRRAEIEHMRREAQRNIDHQRRTSGGRDIVDMVMDRAVQTTPARFNRKPTTKESSRMSKVQKFAKSVRRLLVQETAMYEDGLDWAARGITRMRQQVERELVYSVAVSAHWAGLMTDKEQRWWHSKFTRKEHEKREAAGCRIDTLRELDRYM
ncbi:hypothetical protein LTR08_007556 [Meristemomyces frigidus]|nr:hypothetical protein LTR08_007556 [Meristemomyces frigidus]